mmetsp:Transcript_30765/g.41772  ORF Transcript_30765/g.41772 Transcript_30765/m.41772 type:complete len:93 (-) Transcript_30765:18-296(-)
MHNNSRINYSEFIIATIKVDHKLTEERKHALFHMFDVDSSNDITREDIKNAFNKLGHEVTDDEINDIFKTHDSDCDGIISYEDFMKILLENK